MVKKEDYLKYLQDVSDANYALEIAHLMKAVSQEEPAKVGLTKAMYLALQSVTVYEGTMNQVYLDRAVELVRKGFACYRRFLEHNPEESQPVSTSFAPLNFLFAPALFCRLIRELRKYNAISIEDEKTAELIARKACDWACEYTDWGTHNRAIARGTSLLYSYNTFPLAPESGLWKRVAYALITDNIGRWTIEDSSTYNPIWVQDLFEIGEEIKIENPNYLTILKYYLDLYTYVQNPVFMPTEFGDGRFGTQWAFVVSILERGATLFNNGYYKYVASRIFQKMAYLGDLTGFNAGQSRAIVSAYHFASDDVKEQEPYGKSMEVMDDYVGKKIIFRNGWDENATYLFLNYRDFSETGILGRRNLDYTIIAPAEKNHHGHSDENAINLLLYKNSVLLHDGGYREVVDNSGAYRADFYHNKLIVRNGHYPDYFETMFQEPNHNRVRTEKLYFYDLKYLDSSRTRIYDQMHHVVCDRAINYLKNENLFVVVDMVKATKDGTYTFSNQYFTQEVGEIKNRVFQTSFKEIATDEVVKTIPNNDQIKLTIAFFGPKDNSQIVIRDLRRSYQTETMLAEVSECDLAKDEIFATVTLLVPNENCINQEVLNSITVHRSENGISVSLTSHHRYYELDFKLNEEKGLEMDKLPMYSYEKMHVNYQRASSDALFSSYVIDNDTLTFNFVAGSKLIFDQQTIFACRNYEFKQFDFNFATRVGQYSQYEDTIKFKK